MKKTFFGSMKIMALLLVAAAGLMTSCEDRGEDDVVGANTPINITASIGVFNTQSRATDTSFEEGDAIGLHVVTSTPHHNNAKYTFSNGEFVAAQKTNWYDSPSLKAHFIAYYPYNTNAAYSAKTGYTINLKMNQGTAEAYKESDLMFAQTWSTPTKEAVHLPFKHILFTKINKVHKLFISLV